MAASVQFRPQNRDLGMIMREVDEDLAIFLGMRNADKERNDHPAPPTDSDDFNESKGLQAKPNCSLPLNREHVVPIAAEDHFLTEKSDYNWQPDSSLLDPIEVNMQLFPVNAPKTLQNEAVSENSEVDNSSKNSDPQTESPLHQGPSPTNSNVSAGDNKRPLLSFKPRKPSPRPAPPTARLTQPAKPRPTRTSTPTSRPALTSSSKPSSRSSTPLRPSSRPSTPNSSRPSGPIPSRPGPRPSTPMRGKPHPTTTTISKAPQDPPKAAGPARPASASRGRANRHDEKPKRLQKSCSPPKMRAQNGGGSRPRGPNSSTVLVRGRGGSNDGEEVNPILMGTKMVERVVSMRKLAPPKPDECVSQDNSWKKSSRLGNSGFGRSLSKKSLDMAIRHMDIRRSMCEN